MAPAPAELAAWIDEVRRVHAAAANTYPRMAREGRMNRHEADRRIGVMRDLLAYLEAQRNDAHDLFADRKG